MSHDNDKLQRDLAIFERFAAEMADYLRSDTLFWPTGPSIPELTLGGALMRQHRLLVLRGLLDSAEQARLDQAVAAFQLAITDQIVRCETHAHREMDARLRQWREYLRDVSYDSSARHYYSSAVDARVMLSQLIDQMQMRPYQLNSDVPRRLEALDKALRARWRGGDFVWPEAWQPAYPADLYWYLWGSPA